MNKIIVLIVTFSLLLTGCTTVNDDKVISSNEEIENKIVFLENKVIKQDEQIMQLSEKIAEQKKIIEEFNKSTDDRLDNNENDMNMVINQFFERNKTEVELDIVKSFIRSLPEYKEVYGWINEYLEGDRKVRFDDLEWISSVNTERIDELKLDIDNDFPNGYHLYNEVEKDEEFSVDESLVIYDLVENGSLLSITTQEFKNQTKEYKPFCKVVMYNGKVIAIIETYIP